MELIKVRDLQFMPYIEDGIVLQRVKELATEIRNDYEGKHPVFLVVLNGAFRFAADLAREVHIESEWQFVKLSSYEGTESSGEVKMVDSITIDLTDRHVIVVEDIVDTGRTLDYFLGDLQSKKPASVRLASCLLKPEALQFPIEVDYLGFEIPNKFFSYKMFTSTSSVRASAAFGLYKTSCT